MAKKAKKKQPVGVGNILEKVIKNLGMAGPMQLARILTRWDKIFDPSISKTTFPRDLRGKTLTVDVENSVWLQQISFMDQMIIDKINKNLGAKVVKKVRYQIGQIPERPLMEENRSTSVLDEVELENEDLDEITESIRGVSDSELRKSLRRILSKDIKLKKYREKLTLERKKL